jgi:amino acid adenylation domain-containing protein
MVELLRDRAAQSQDQEAITFLADRGVSPSVTYAELDERARRFAAQLRTRVRPGDRVLILLPPGLDFIATLFGTFYAGAIAVPAYPPGISAHGGGRLQHMANDCTPSVVVAALEPRAYETLLAQAPGLRAVPFVAPRELDVGAKEAWSAPDAHGDDVAMLQYTSGSTATPKGVMLTHANLFHNLAQIQRQFRLSHDSRGFIWLPPFHDMGLIGGIFAPIFVGFPVTLMSPMRFIRQPLAWLREIARTRATCSGGPSFAYEQCIRRVTPDELATLDLSCWTTAFAGAEVVRAATLERFASTFAPCGFRRAAFLPCYGLAEATLMVSGRARADGPELLPSADERGTTLVGCGEVVADATLRIVDVTTASEVAPGDSGEIWVKSPSVARGYWKRPAETEALFGARLADGSGPFLRTGDIGFVRDGSLFVTGRRKEVIIIRGRNHHPNDLEQTVERCDPALGDGSVVAFSVEGDEGAHEEELVIVLEAAGELARGGALDDALAQLATRIRAAVVAAHDVTPRTIVAVGKRRLPKTSSGKLQRGLAKAQFLAGELEPLWSSRPAAAEPLVAPVHDAADGVVDAARVATVMREFAARFLGVRQLDLEQSPIGLGLDSLGALELREQLEGALGIELPTTLLLEQRSFAALGDEIVALAAAPVRARRDLAPPPSPGRQRPLSAAQRRVWVATQLADASAPAHHIPVALRLHGRLSLPALTASIAQLVARHETLRTIFGEHEGVPWQTVADVPATPLGLADLRGAEATALEARCRVEIAAPFDFAHGPLCRWTLLRTADEQHVLLVVAHHLVADGWSVGILARELAQLYRVARGANEPSLPPLPVSYADCAAWEQAATPDDGAALAYWREQLGDAPERIELATDRPRSASPARAATSGARVGRVLPVALLESLTQQARTLGVTPFVLFLSALAVVLQRWSGQSDLTIGTVASQRPRPETRGLVGDFTNFLALRLRLDGTDDLAALVALARQVVLAAFAQGQVPFEKVVETVRRQRNDKKAQLYNVGLIQHSFAFPRELSLTDELHGTLELLDNGGSEIDLMFEVATTSAGLELYCTYRDDLFTAGTAERLLDGVETVLRALATMPATAPLAQLPVMSAAERRRVTAEWNDTARAYPTGTLLHQLVEAQVARTPNAVAVEAEGGRLTYRALDQAANRLAQRLVRLGVRPDTRVGVLAERSPELVVGLLAVLKAGGAYLPIDPKEAPERLAFQLRDSGVELLLIQERFVARVASLAPPPIVTIDDAAAAGAATAAPDVAVRGENLAYVIYTSGSTGAPKGAMNTHAGIVNRLRWMQETYALDGSDAVLQKTPLTFDVSVWELFLPLMTGARLVLARPGAHGDAAYLAQVMAAAAVTTVHFVPPMLNAFLEADASAAQRSLRRVICSGEALPAALQRRFWSWREPAGRHIELHNLYGPTEAAVDVSAHACQPDAGASSVPIGRPIANTRLYVLDRALRPLPVGAVGQLYIAGVQLARGYLGRPDLTAERFVPDPFADEPGARMYCTGDLARHRPDGDLEFIGRVDEQVKLRGFRIELGEVRAAIAAHPSVQEAVVVAGRQPNGDARLVAYVVTTREVALPVDELRLWLQRKVPEHMIPAAICYLDALPLNRNGKVDHRALPEPTTAAAPDGHDERGSDPQTLLVANLCAELLGLDHVAPNGNFILLGGHSLLVTQLAARLRKVFGVEVPLVALFEARDVREIAALVAQARPDAVTIPTPHRYERGDCAPLGFAQERLWYLTQVAPELTSYHVPRALVLRGALDVATLERTFTALLARHEILRTRFPLVDGRPQQQIAAPAPVTIPVVDLSALAEPQRGAESLRRIDDEGRRLFDLERGPLIRLTLLRLAGDEHVLILTEHHLVHDGWTQGVLARDFMRLYEALAAGQEPSLPELPLQYADYALWQRDWVKGAARERLVAHWQERLTNLPTLRLPTDRPRPAVQSFRGAEERFEIPAALADQLRALSKRHGTTLFMTVLATFNVLLARHSGQDDVPVGIAVANRRWSELEGLIGMLINTLVHRCDLSGDPTFSELLTRVRRVALEDYAFQDLPFEQVVSSVRPDRSLGQLPLAQVWLGFQDVPEPELRLPGLEVEVVYRHNGSAKNDLSLMLVPHAEQQIGAGEVHGDRGITGLLEYSTDLFDRETIVRLVRHFSNLLQAVVADAERPISALPMLDEGERQALLAAQRGAALDPPVEGGVIAELAAHVARAPHALALCAGATTLSYGELDARSNQLAARLRAHGVGPEVRVGVCLARSAEWIVAMLGVFKAGGVYVPIDPDWPAARVRFVAEDARATALVTTNAALQSLAPQARLLDPTAHPLTDEPEGDAATIAEPWPLPRLDQQAYLIYTSGTTGRPNGVMVSHGNLAALLASHRRYAPLTAGDRATQSASIAFDASLLESLPPLTSGASLHLVPEEVKLAPDRLAAWLVEQEITVGFLPTALAEPFLQHDAGPALRLRRLQVGGDRLGHHRAPHHRFTLLNAYGPTETTIVASCGEVGVRAGQSEPPDIGAALAGCVLYVLDRSGQPVPVGVPGELYVGGPQVARGYHGRPELTAERFVPDPFSSWPGARIYRTGDLVRHTAEGRLAFLGRVDEQVKIRGFRIELGEIEARLLQRPDLLEASVLCELDGRGEKSLVAYVVTTGAFDAQALREGLRAELPAYMVPAAFVHVKNMPLTHNGKVDRRALSTLQRQETPLAALRAPRTATETAVAAIFAELLDVAAVDVERDFFALGGHSLLAAQVVTRLRSQLDCDLPLRLFLAAPTVAALAAAIDLVRGAAGALARREPLDASSMEEGEL